MELLTVIGIGLEENGTTVLQAISFSRRAGQKLTLTGESGTGKSPLLQVIAGLIQPSGGEVLIRGRRVRGPAETLVPGHSGVAHLLVGKQALQLKNAPDDIRSSGAFSW